MTKRINIVLPLETIRVLDRVAPKGNRSRLISEAVMHYVGDRGKKKLAEQLKQGAIANAQSSLEIAQDWFPADEEAWTKSLDTESPSVECGSNRDHNGVG